MIKKIVSGGIIALGIIISSPAMAHSYINVHIHEFESIQPINHVNHHHHRPKCVSAANIDQRQNNQQRRIRNGIKKGKIFAWEIKKLNKMQRRIHKQEKKMRRNGNCLTKKEEKQLQNMLNKASKKIRQFKRNDFMRPVRHYHRPFNHDRPHRNHR